MNKKRSTVALMIGTLSLPLLIGFVFYILVLRQDNLLSWYGFVHRLWAGPYFGLGTIICITAFSLGLYWLPKDLAEQAI
jgi:hypothetical protein